MRKLYKEVQSLNFEYLQRCLSPFEHLLDSSSHTVFPVVVSRLVYLTFYYSLYLH